MGYESQIVLGILGVVVVLFVSDALRVDVVALMTLAALVIFGILTPQDAFLGFASPAVVTVWAVFIISGGLYESGVADWLAQRLVLLVGNSQRRLLLLVMVLAGGMSAFMNNIGAVAILMPAVVSICRQMKISPSRMLMPLAFAALLGGNITLIGTPPNILASELLVSYGGLSPFGFFDFAPLGVISLLSGIGYMLGFGRHILPDHAPIGGDVSSPYPVREYATEVRVRTDSPLSGRPIDQVDLQVYDLNLLQVRHKGEEIGFTDDYALQEGDVLVVEGYLPDIVRFGVEQDIRLNEEWGSEENKVQPINFAEIGLTSTSRRKGQTLKDMDFRNRYGLSVVAIRPSGRVSYTSHLGDLPISFGDELLVHGSPDRIRMLHDDPNFLVLDTPPEDSKRSNKIPVALLILFASLVIITAGWLDAATALLCAAIAMVLAGVITMDEAYRTIDWKSVFLIAGLLPLGLAMEQTGTARWLADQVVIQVGQSSPMLILAALFLLTSLLTSFVSNAATTVLMVPIGLDAAANLGASPYAFVMAVVLAASTSFVTPVGHQVNVIILGPGGYRFRDYVKVGLGLNVLMLILAIFVLPIFWPLYSN